MIAMPDPETFAVLPWRPEEQGVGRMFCDVITPERTPYEGDPRHVLRRALERAGAMGFDTFNVGPELEYFLFRDSRSTEVLDQGGYFDLTTLDAGSDVRRETVLALEQLGHPRRVHPPRGGALPARDRHALRGRDEDGRRLHDLPHHGQGDRDEVRVARHLHAQAAVRRERLGNAHPPVAVPAVGTTPSTTPTTSTSSRTSARPSSPVSSSTRARSARSSPSGSTPTSAWFPASRRRYTWPGRAATAPRWCGCRCITRGVSGPPGWSCAARTRRATPTSPSRSCCRPGWRGSRRATSSPSRWRRTSTTSPARSAGASGVEQLPESLGEAIELTAESELVLRTLGEHMFNRYVEIKRQEWDDYRVQVTSGSWTATWRSSRSRSARDRAGSIGARRGRSASAGPAAGARRRSG